MAISINKLKNSGVMLRVGEAAIMVTCTIIAGKLGLNPKDVKKDWMNSLLPGIKPVPSGVWAIGRAHEPACA